MPSYWMSLMRTAARASLQLGSQTGDVAQVEQAIRYLAEIIETGHGGRRERAAVLTLRGRASLRLATWGPRRDGALLRNAVNDFDAALALTDRHAAPGLWAGIVLARADARRLLAVRTGATGDFAKVIEEYEAALAAMPEAEDSPRRGAALTGIARARLARAVVGGEDDARAIAAMLDPAR